MKSQESCVTNEGKTTKKRGACQGDPISTYLFLLALEIFLLSKMNSKIKSLQIFNHCYVFTDMMATKPFFLEDVQSIEYHEFLVHSSCSGLKQNLTKC